MDETHNELKNFLNKCGIVFENFAHLNGMLIPRDLLVSEKKYEEIKKEIQNIKKIYSSSSLTSLQVNAGRNQKWPLLNLVRQLLKQLNYSMEPTRKSAGYDETGKKKYERFFKLKKLNSINTN
tara:strand:- start:149 stop:517 length:369 start_codon:yes stop_codon:yes gene_type:complete